MTAPPDGVEVVPRLWIGSNRTCDVLRQNFSFVCINCGVKAHTQDQRCNFIPVCSGPNGFVDYAAMARVERLLIPQRPQGNVLIHCADALTYSPLVAALWLSTYYNQPLATSYQWVKAAQPGLQDLSRLAQPVSTNTAWAGR